MPPPAHIDPTSIDSSRVIADREAIRRANPHRFDLEQTDRLTLLRNTLTPPGAAVTEAGLGGARFHVAIPR